MKLVMSTMCLILLVAGCGGPDSDAPDSREAETPGGAIGAGYVEALEDACEREAGGILALHRNLASRLLDDRRLCSCDRCGQAGCSRHCYERERGELLSGHGVAPT